MGSACHEDGSSKTSSSSRPHALAIPLPLLGHINPMMQLARKLASNGFIVTLVNLASNHDKFLQATFDEDEQLDIRFESVPDRVPVHVARLDIFSSPENRSIFRRACQAMESDVEELLRARLNPCPCEVSCIIGDVFFNWIARVAGTFGLPKFIFSTTCASSMLIDQYIPRLLATGDIPVQDGDENDERPVAAELPGMPAPFHISDLPYYLGVHSQTAFQGRFEKAQSLVGCDWVLVNSCEALEPGAFRALQASVNPNIVGIGPLLSSSDEKKKNSSHNAAWSEDRECLAWLDDGKPPESVLYVSFGSLATMPPEQFVELAEGLVSSGQAFLLAVRPNLLLVGHEFEPLADAAWELLKKAQEQGHACLVPWAPQLEVLGHPSVGGFLTHCGWNSLLESICCGVPVLGWPQAFEQNLNCRIACGEWNIGSRITTMTTSSRVVGRGEIAESIKALMVGEQGKAMRANVRELREVVMNGAGDRNLDAFMAAAATSRIHL